MGALEQELLGLGGEVAEGLQEVGGLAASEAVEAHPNGDALGDRLRRVGTQTRRQGTRADEQDAYGQRLAERRREQAPEAGEHLLRQVLRLIDGDEEKLAGLVPGGDDGVDLGD